jgi:hypothetical protein
MERYEIISPEYKEVFWYDTCDISDPETGLLWNSKHRTLNDLYDYRLTCKVCDNTFPEMNGTFKKHGWKLSNSRHIGRRNNKATMLDEGCALGYYRGVSEYCEANWHEMPDSTWSYMCRTCYALYSLTPLIIEK